MAWVVPLTLFAGPFFARPFQVDFEVSTLLTIVALLFAILVGFFIATTTTNYLRLQTLIADEDGTLIAVYHACRSIASARAGHIAGAIDRYVTATLDYEIHEYVDATVPEFDAMISAIEAVRPREENGRALYAYLHEKTNDFFRTRQEITFTSRRIVQARHWAIIIGLNALILICLYALYDGTWLFALIIGILSVATYFVLVLIYEIDGNYFLESLLAYENAQKIFKEIGMLPYYPEIAIVEGRVHPRSVTYRIGVMKGGKRLIKIVNP